MCAALSDPDALVREQAAWALRWGEDERDARLSCLRGAQGDRVEEVRREAAESVELLTRTP
jgi:HEAT repeat protein